MALTSDQLKANATAMKQQGASDTQVQSYLDGFKGQTPDPSPAPTTDSGTGIFSHLMNAGGDLMKGNILGAAGNVAGAGYTAAKDVAQAVVTPTIMRFAAMAPEAYDMFTGNTAGVESIQKNGYNFGDFFGTAKPLQPVDVTKSPIDEANLRALSDTAGTALNTAAWAVGGPEKAAIGAGEAAVGATKGLISKGMDYLAGSAKSSIGKFSAMTGAGTGLQAYGAGQTPGQATMTGMLTAATTAAFMKVADVTGGWLKGNFWSEAQKTQAGQFFQKQLSDVGKKLQEMLPGGAEGKVAKTLSSSYDTLQEKTNTALTGFLSGIRKTVNNPTNEDWVHAMASNIQGKFRQMNQQIAAGFDKSVFGGNTVIKVSDGLRTAYENAIKKLASAQDLNAGVSDVSTSLGRGLADTLGMIRRNFIEPGEFNMKDFSNMLDFVETSGTPAEVAIANDVRGALYANVESELKNMGVVGERKLAAWTQFKNAATSLSNQKDAAFTKIWPLMNSPKTLANKFLDGSILKDADQMKELEALIGVDGVAALKGILVHTAIGNAIDQFGKTVVQGVASSYDDARKAASAELQKYIDLAVGTKMGFRPLSAAQTQMMKDFQALVQGTNIDNLAEKWGVTAPEVAAEGQKAAAMMDVTARAKQAYEVAKKSPSALAGEISKMTDIKDVKSVLSLVGSQENKTLVGMGIIKDMFTQFSNAFTKTGTKTWADTIKKLGSIGGPDREAILNELFGKSPETKALVDGIDTATKAIEALSEAPDSKALKRAGDAVLGLGFLMAHHPIIATGFFKGALRGGESDAGNIFQEFFGKTEEEFQASMEKNGDVTIGGLKGVMRLIGRKIGSVLQSRAGQYTIGTAGAETGGAVGDIINPVDNQDNTQPQ